MSRPGEACDAQAAAELFRALAHPMRVRILCRLLAGEVSVAGLEDELGLRQASLSQQLGQLRDAGIVTTRRAARTVYDSLADQRARILIDALRTAGDTARSEPAAPAPAARPLPPLPRPTPPRRQRRMRHLRHRRTIGIQLNVDTAGWRMTRCMQGGKERKILFTHEPVTWTTAMPGFVCRRCTSTSS
jgi:DNA-binding transcriptional ArsR family regulator